MDENQTIPYINQNEISSQTQNIKPIITKIPYEFNEVDKIFAIIAFILGYLSYNFFFIFPEMGAYISLYIFLYVVVIYSYALIKKVKISKESLFLTSIILIIGSSMTVIYNNTLWLLMDIFLKSALVYLPLDICQILLKKNTSEYVIYDFISAAIIIPFSNFTVQWQALIHKKTKSTKYSAFNHILLGIVGGSPFIIIIIYLLSSADETLEKLLSGFINNFLASIRLDSIFMTIILAAYTYAIFYSSVNKRNLNPNYNVENIESKKKNSTIPRLSLFSINTILCVFYILFIAIQFVYFIRILNHNLPVGFTYADYARRGFFELMLIALLNLLWLWFMTRFAIKIENNIFMKIHVILLSLLTMALILVDIAKMILYIHVYGLTALRVLTSVFMIYLTIIFALVILEQKNSKIQTIRLSLYLGAIMFTLLVISDMDARITDYNLTRYLGGSLPHFDVENLRDGGLAAVPTIYKHLENTTNSEKKENIEEILKRIKGDYSDYKATTNYNFAREQAIFYLNKIKE